MSTAPISSRRRKPCARIDVLAGTDRRARLMGDELVGVDVLRRHGLLQPHQVQRLHALGHLLPGRIVVARVHVGADVDVGPTACRAAVI